MTPTTDFPRMHVSLYVSDLKRTIHFYEAIFGMDPDKVKPGYARFTIPNPALVISFLENPELVQPGFGHLGFQLKTPEELNQRLLRMKELNLVSKEEEGVACCYAVQDKFWLTDPDGYKWEMYYFHSDAEFNDPRYQSSEAEACCAPAQKTTMPVEETCCEPGSGCC